MKTANDIIENLIDLMERDDRIKFGIEDAEPVTNDEWFSGINEAKEFIRTNLPETFFDMYRSSSEQRQNTEILPDGIVSLAIDCPRCGVSDRPMVDAVTDDFCGMVPQTPWTCPFCGLDTQIECTLTVTFQTEETNK